MHWSTEQTSAPAEPPLTIPDLKTHSRIDTAADDEAISAYIQAARASVENITGRQLITATWKLYMRDFPRSVILLPRPPLQSVTSIEYVDGDGVTQTWSSSEYDVDDDSEPARIERGYGESWPTSRDVPQAVTVTYDAGYGDTHYDVPEDIKHALRLLVAQWYENRENVVVGAVAREVPMAVRSLLTPFIVNPLEDDFPGY